MSMVTIGEYIAKRIEQLGIKDYFAIPGDFNLALLDEILKNPNLNMINCCNELNTGYAADGYARGNGIAAMVVTFSVGSLSAINAIAGAYAENLPVIIISGGPNINSIAKNHILHHTLAQTDGRQEYVRNMFKNVTAHTVIVDNIRHAAYDIDYALTQAVIKKKPVYIEVACNLSGQKISAPNPLNFNKSMESDPDSLKAAVAHAATFLNNAHNPALVAGGMLRSNQGIDAFKQLADVSGYGTACMPDAKSFFSETHPSFIGIYWGSVSSPGCQEVIESCDAYLFAGPIFNDFVTVGFTTLLKTERMVEVGPDFVKVQDQYYNHVMLKDFLEELALKITKNEMTVTTYSKIKCKSTPPPLQNDSTAITTRGLFAHVNQMLDSQTTIVAETGDSWFNGIDLKLPDQARFEVQMQYGSIGWSVGAFLGLAAADPTRKHIALIGDGSFQMSAQELSTFLRYGYKGTVFLLNNFGYVIEVKIHDGPYNFIQNWKYAALVDVWKDQGKGQAWTVSTDKELAAAIKESESCEGLNLIEVILDREDCNKNLLSWGSQVANYNSQQPRNFSPFS